MNDSHNSKQKKIIKRGDVLEKIIGMFDEQTIYAERLKNYINENKEIGCFAVVFQQEQEILDFCKKKKLSYLLVGEETLQKMETIIEQLSYGIKIWVLTEETSELTQKEAYNTVFRYQKAKEIIQKILLSEVKKIECLSMLYTVCSPENSQIAFSYTKQLIERLTEQGKVLFLFWDSFSGYGKQEIETVETPSISELLYLVRKDKLEAKKLFGRLPKKNGAEYFCGPDYCTDLWQYSAEEMQQLIRCCQEYGGYQSIVFLAGIFSEGVISVLNQSSKIYLVFSKTQEGERRKQEFYRQMKYAGEQEILSKLIEVTEG